MLTVTVPDPADGQSAQPADWRPDLQGSAARSTAFPVQRPHPVVVGLFRIGTSLYRGPLAALFGAYSMLLLTTTGRKTGLPRRTALIGAPLGGHYLVGAGLGTRSDWYRNLLAEPRVVVQVGRKRFSARADPVLDPDRRRELVPRLAVRWDRYGPPRPFRRLIRFLFGFDYDAEAKYALAHAESVPLVELVPLEQFR
ncbi:MAG: nitroreductase family deazaflavin-dependent oxidoreductase [Chloroflexi bacterium]|nr:nitroreductase family deazaflavin-dependent oxidoreductase [Chloroflexota bacterium]